MSNLMKFMMTIISLAVLMFLNAALEQKHREVKRKPSVMSERKVRV